MYDNEVSNLDVWLVACRGGTEGASGDDGLGDGVWCGSPRGWCFQGPSKSLIDPDSAISDPVEAHDNFL